MVSVRIDMCVCEIGLLLEGLLLFLVVETAEEGVELVLLPVLKGCFCPLDFLVCLELLFVKFQVTPCYYVVVPQTSRCHLLDFLLLKQNTKLSQ